MKKLQTQIQNSLQSDHRQSDRDVARRFGVSNRTVSLARKRLEKDGLLLRRVKSTHSVEACLQEVCIGLIKEAPENDLFYDPVNKDDPSFLALVKDIRENGLQTTIQVSSDGFVFDGHRRLAAVRFLGWEKVTVRIRPDVSYYGDREKFLTVLRSCNKQRVKTIAEVTRENIADMEEETTQRVCSYRKEVSQVNGVERILLYGSKQRSEIRDKIGLKKAIVQIVKANENYWPLSDRKVFYLLLNLPGLLRNDRLITPFENNPECYNDVTDMVTRLRLDGSIPFDSIADETRPVIQWETHRSVGTFVQEELADLFSGFWRDLQQSQPNWIELLAEKNTIASSLEPIAAKYTIPMTSGRGYSSLPPRKNMVERFLASGREKLVLIVVSDFDPEGEDIPNSFGISLRDDFEIPAEKLVIVKAALTYHQTKTLSLHEGQFAKRDSSRYKRFLDQYGDRCWELESVPTEVLRKIVESTIRSVLDLEAFEKELALEKREKFELDNQRGKVKELIKNL